LAKRWAIRIGLALIILTSFLGLLGLGLFVWVWSTGGTVYDSSSAVGEDYPVAIVFGAGQNSPILRERVMTGVRLYRTGSVKKLLMSGDNRFVDYNEPRAMQRIALAENVPPEDIILDYAGRRTYDTCYRAREIFEIERAVLISNGYHLPRALYTCRKLGMAAVGLRSDPGEAPPSLRSVVREIPASIIAWWQTHTKPPAQILGDKIPISFDRDDENVTDFGDGFLENIDPEEEV